MSSHPRDSRTLLGHLGGPHKAHCSHEITRNAVPFAVRNSPTNCSQMQFTSSSHPREGREGKGHQGQCPYTLGCVCHCLGAWVGHPHPTVVTHSAPDTAFDRSNCGSGVVRWCAHHLQAARTAMGHWGQCPHTLGIAGRCLVTLGDQKSPLQSHTALPTPYSMHVFDCSNCGWGVVRWCAPHLHQLGSPCGTGSNAFTP